MKHISIFLLCLFSASAHANAPENSLFHYTVYAKNSISAACSDFQGRTAAGGPVNLYNFMVRMHAGETGCALESQTSVQIANGNVRVGEQTSCVAAPYFNPINMDYTPQYAPRASFLDLNYSMDNLSATLAAGAAYPGVKTVTMHLNPNHNHGYLTLDAGHADVLVVNFPETTVSIVDYGIVVNGGINPKNIIWNFPNATTVKIARSGMEFYGLPGTFIAPHAAVYFNNALITGALYADSIVGNATDGGCSGTVGGQVNGSCVDSPIPGVGCSVPPPVVIPPPPPYCPTPVTPPTPVCPGAGPEQCEPVPAPLPPPVPLPGPDQHQHQHPHPPHQN